MRWDSLRDRPGHGGEQPPAAPALFDAPAVITRADPPGFRGITFFEIRSRSVINKLPAASRMPFGWTINPYRGCSHACVYCFARPTHVTVTRSSRARTIGRISASKNSSASRTPM